MTLNYDQMTVAPPSFDAVANTYDTLNSDFDAAGSDRQRSEVVERWDLLCRGLNTWEALVHVRYAQDTRDVERKAAKDVLDEMQPKLEDLSVTFKKRLLASPHSAAVERRFGKHLFNLWRSDIASFDPSIEADLVAEAKRSSEYTSLMASAKIDFNGETLNLSGLGKYANHGDRSLRHGAATARWNWMAEQGDTLDTIYDDLVRMRHEMARKLGYANFVELGYQRMQRTDYNRADVARFRKTVSAQVVPVVSELRNLQRERLGLDKIMAWDSGLYRTEGNPNPHGDHDWMVDRASEMFAAMDPGLSAFFETMRSRGLLDLKTRDGKAGGGFCTFFPDHGVPFVFANFNGTDGDVKVFTHEIGHAFQSYTSRANVPYDLVWPTYEAAEIHSMSLEYLTWPQMELFFGDEADTYRWIHLAGSMAFLPYGVLGDHFQHEVYENPGSGAAARHDMWRKLEHHYQPSLDWGDLDYAAKGGRWQMQGHFFGMPFYYIDYTLALTCALQMWLLSRNDKAGTFERYHTLCGLGGSRPFQELVASAGLTSPFADGCLTDVVREVRSVLFPS